MGSRWAWRASTGLELLVVAAAFALTVRTSAATPVALLGLAIFRFRRVATVAYPRSGSAGVAVLALLAMALLAFTISLDVDLSIRRLFGLLFGVYVFLAVWDCLAGRPWLVLAAHALVLAGGGVAALGLIATNWSNGKIPGLAPVYERLPRIQLAFQSSDGVMQRGLSVNELAGVLLLLLPMAVVPARRGYVRILIGVSTAMMIVTLMLAASRSAWLASVASVGAALLIISHHRRTFGLVVAAVVVAVVTGLVSYGGDVDLIFSFGPDELSWARRLEIWRHSLYMVQSFPFTGTGLNMFPIISDLLFPFSLFEGVARLPHAHNFILQVALDFGLPGAAAFLVLLLGVVGKVAAAYRQCDGIHRHLALGVGLALFSHLIYGLTDAVALGARAGVALWTIMGLGAALRPESIVRIPPAESSAGELAEARTARGLYMLVWSGYAFICIVAAAAVWSGSTRIL